MFVLWENDCVNFFLPATCELVSRFELQSSLSRVFDALSNWVFNPAQPHLASQFTPKCPELQPNQVHFVNHFKMFIFCRTPKRSVLRRHRATSPAQKILAHRTLIMIEQLNLQEGTDHLEQEAAVATEDAAPAVMNSELGLALAAIGASNS